MKIGILTQPLLNNYGGLLQAYALQTVLKEMDNEVWIINRNYAKPSVKSILKNQVKRILLKTVYKNSNLTLNPNSKEELLIGKYTNYFKEKYIHPITSKITNNEEVQEINTLGFHAFVVGSDQVWRPRYSPNIANYFLDFAKDASTIKKIAYAASFGVSNWEYSNDETANCSKLAQKFNAISVREDSGVALCKTHLGVSATHVLDPTMLLDVKNYIHLIQEEKEPESEGTLMTYVLDKSIDKNNFIQDVASHLKLKPFTVMQKEKLTGKTKIENAIFPPVTKWLKGFMDAEFIITDSFHGCAFSIIFNKPFLALGNKKRGVARFTSLLKMFNLEDRLILDDFSFNKALIDTPVDWTTVNTILKSEQKKSLSFLEYSLK